VKETKLLGLYNMNSPAAVPTPFQVALERYQNALNYGSSVCVMQWTGVIRDGTLMLERHLAIFVNCF
jgi:hypothetical protein